MKGTFPRRRLGRLLIAVAMILGASAIGAQAAAALTTVETMNPFAFAATNPCTGEAFSGTGAMHFLIGGTLSTSGMTQSHMEANLQGMKATTVTGKKYVVVDTANKTIVFDSDLMPYHEKLEWTVQFVRQGEDGTLFTDDDYYEHFLAHATVNANGVVTVDDYTFDTYCK